MGYYKFPINYLWAVKLAVVRFMDNINLLTYNAKFDLTLFIGFWNSRTHAPP